MYSNPHIFYLAEMAAAAGPKRTRQTYTRYQTLELEKVIIIIMTTRRVIIMRLHPVGIITVMTTTQRVKYV